MPEISANARASIPARKATVRRRGTGLCGWTESTRRTAHSHQTTVAAMARVGIGCQVQPSSSDAAVGGSAGTGPWARTGPAATAAASSPVSPATVARIACRPVIGEMVPRTGVAVAWTSPRIPF